MKLYYFNPNDYGSEFFVMSNSKTEALEQVKNSKHYDSKLFKDSTIYHLPSKYTIDEYELNQVIRSELA